ncbi:MAG: shikimate dehydrogenase [Gammaproteobacteria bacterium]|nr:MAG: shikimate dehydrogenase [Pseudomonadota bacterium]PIE38305.1 MAG: shikimate dehydrogenase [Gammaproteobacteria bacterium]
MGLYAVLGHPVGHSKSPQIHGYFARQTGQDMDYVTVQPPLDGFTAEAEDFFARGGLGFNVTVPFKEEAFNWVTRLSERASLAGAVNTVYLNSQGETCGDNTDGIGLVRDLTHNHQVDLKNRRLLVLGAGGAVRGTLKPLLDCHPAEIVIANRTLARAEALASLFSPWGTIRSCAFGELSDTFDIVINGTSAGLAGSVPAVPERVIGSHTVAYDMIYSDKMTAFNRWAKQHGCHQQIDGLGMLVEQAAEAFEIWRGVKPDGQVVVSYLRQL